MNIAALSFAVLLGLGQSAEFPSGKAVRDRWEALESQGARVGTLHTEIQTLEGGQNDPALPARKIRETLTLDLKRFQKTIQLKMVREDLESQDGFLLASRMEQFNGNQLQASLEARPKGKDWVLTNHLSRDRKTISTPQKPMGLAKLQEMMEIRKNGVYLHYEPLVNTFILTEIQAQPKGKDTQLTLKPRSLSGGVLPVGDSRILVDARGEFSQREFEMTGLGAILAVPASRATAGSGRQPALDIGMLGLIPLNRTIPLYPTPQRVIYRLHAEDGIDLGQLLAADDRQVVRILDQGFVEVTTSSTKPPARRVGGHPGREYSAVSKIIDFTNPFIQEMARNSGAYEGDCWSAAKRMEKYVQRILTIDAAAPLGSAGDAATSKRGDCRHAALLLCAMCRAVNMPARTATGLIYVERNRPEGGKGPFLGFHMWTEVHIDGQWIGLDGTLGKGGISPRHIKISDQSWHEEESLAPLAPVLKLVGKLQAEILRVDAAP